MKALIFNSGLGSRLGKLTAKNPKAMVRLGNGETIFGRQLRILYACGIREFVITTGPHSEQLIGEAAKYVGMGCSFTFVPNVIYDKTNYIYSMYRAQEYLRGSDFIFLHGDLVFDAAYAQMVIDAEEASLGSVNASLPRPEKDFKARVIDGEVREVSVKIFDDNCIAFQPFYKLSAQAVETWLGKVIEFVEDGDVKVYAENAANTVFDQMGVKAFSYANHYVEEVDTPEDLARVSAGIRVLDFEQQPVMSLGGGSLKVTRGCAVGGLRNVTSVAELAEQLEMKRPLVVVGKGVDEAKVKELLGEEAQYTLYDASNAKPSYEEIMVGVRTYQVYGCDSILSIGDDTAIDVAKAIKIFAPMPHGADERYAEGNYDYSPIKHVAASTAAESKSGRSATATALVDGNEVVIEHDCLQPEVLILNA